MKKIFAALAGILLVITTGLALLVKYPGLLVRLATDRIIEASGSRFLDDGGCTCSCAVRVRRFPREIAPARARRCLPAAAFSSWTQGPAHGPTSLRQGSRQAGSRGYCSPIFTLTTSAELGEAVTKSWIMGRRGALPVYGPPGVERVVRGFNDAYEADRQYRTAHHGAEHMPSEAGTMAPVRVECAGPGNDAVVLDEGGLKIIAFMVDHRPVSPAYGYRIEYKGKSAVISGDTRKCENLVKHSAGADVLVHEAIAGNLSLMAARRLKERGLLRLADMAEDAIEYHTLAVDAVSIARQAGVKKLVFTHLAPPVPVRFAGVRAADAVFK